MQPLSASQDCLQEIYELNRLFVEFLRARAGEGGDCLGLGRAAAALVRDALPERLEALAQFPRALFRLTLPGARALRIMDPQFAAGEPSWHALQLTLLHSAWNMCRRSGYAARSLLALQESDVRALRTTVLFELPRLAASAALVSCAFADCPWLWRRLLTETRPEARRQLLLIGLQPQIETGSQQPRGLGQQAFA